MAHVRVMIDLAFPASDDGNVDPKAKAVYDALLRAVEAARSASVDVTSVESTTVAKKHVCRHAEGLPCVEEVEIGVAPRVSRSSIVE